MTPINLTPAKDGVKDFFEDFKTFAIKGNAIELAVGVVIGTAFNAIVDSLVKDVILGAIATAFGKPDFSAFAYGAIKYGNFINSLMNFIIVGLSVFVAIRAMNKLFKTKLGEPKEAAKQ
ncbi:MAG TPA: large conductance mechanosensitive channel protein MscL [Candidatus Paceibacterota bacterium]